MVTPASGDLNGAGREMVPRPAADVERPAPTTQPLIIPIRGPKPPRLRWPRRLPAWILFAVPVLVALPVGLAAGSRPTLAFAAAFGAIGFVALFTRVEWAVAAVVAAAAFDDYLLSVEPRLAKGLAALAIGAWMLRRCAGPLHRRAYSPAMMGALAFLVVLLASTVAHANGSAGQAVVIRYAGFLAILVVLADTMRGGQITPERVARVYVFASAAAACAGIASYLLGQDRRVGGPIGDPNDFAFFLITAVPFALALRRKGRDPSRTWPYDLAAILVLLAIVGTLSRGAMLGLAAMVMFAVVTRMVRLRVAVLGAVVLGAALALTAALFPEMVSTSLAQKDYVAGQNVSERLELWQAAGQMTVENPLLGLGPGSFALYHQDYIGALPADVNHRLDVAHNTYLEVSSELGFLGLGMFLLMLLLAFVGAWVGWRRTRDPLAAAVCAALIGSVVSATFVTEQYALTLWLLVAFGAVYGVPYREQAD